METNEFTELYADIEREQRRAKSAKHLDAHRELAENVYPLLQAMLEAIDARQTETERTVAEYIEGSILEPDVSAQILVALDTGVQLCDLVERTTLLDSPRGKEIQKLIADYRTSAQAAAILVTDITVADDEDDEDDEDDDEVEEEVIEAPGVDASGPDVGAADANEGGV